MVLDAAYDTTMIILSISAVISLALGLAFPETYFDTECECLQQDSNGWIEGVAILVAVVLVVMVSAIQDFDKELKFRALGKNDVRYIKVVRNGNVEEVQTTHLYCGDVVLLETGKFVPADGFVISEDDVKVGCFAFLFFFYSSTCFWQGGRKQPYGRVGSCGQGK